MFAVSSMQTVEVVSLDCLGQVGLARRPLPTSYLHHLAELRQNLAMVLVVVLAHRLRIADPHLPALAAPPVLRSKARLPPAGSSPLM